MLIQKWVLSGEKSDRKVRTLAFSNDLIPVFLLCVACFTLVATLLYRLMYAVIHNRIADEHIKILDWGAFRISVIHSLLLTLGFSVTRDDFIELRSVANQQAIEIERIYKGLGWSSDPEAAIIRAKVAELANVLVNEEWPLLSEGELSLAADALMREIGTGLMHLRSNANEPIAEDLLTSHLVVQETRATLSLNVLSGPTRLFWTIASVGFVFTAICLLAYPLSSASTAVMAMFAALNGAVLFGIVVMGNPFERIVKVTPVSLEKVIERSF
ncbi:DUF4239 domain-containing protein [Ruegeria arenilitoris]|uniref:bestrophin-like domain n=1 Tax=Ruegeria arenilitoris TaxID=1173585 RepID=UPI00147E0857|nr:DUF4239 domain-containing protein [Ruegeria arenilitoris]